MNTIRFLTLTKEAATSVPEQVNAQDSATDDPLNIVHAQLGELGCTEIDVANTWLNRVNVFATCGGKDQNVNKRANSRNLFYKTP